MRSSPSREPESRRRYVAIIPARGGSRGIPRKVLAPLGGRPLLHHTVEAALRARGLDGVYVTTEDVEIAREARRAGAQVISRPPRLAEDYVDMAPVVTHALHRIEETMTGEPVSDLWFVLLQPTSPLRSADDIDGALAALERRGARGVVSVVEVDREVYKYMVLDGLGRLQGMVSPHAPFMRRQDCPRVVRPNGAVYAYRAADFLEHGGFHFQDVVPYLMPEERSVDIDEPADLERAAALLAS